MGDKDFFKEDFNNFIRNHCTVLLKEPIQKILQSLLTESNTVAHISFHITSLEKIKEDYNNEIQKVEKQSNNFFKEDFEDTIRAYCKKLQIEQLGALLEKKDITLTISLMLSHKDHYNCVMNRIDETLNRGDI